MELPASASCLQTTLRPRMFLFLTEMIRPLPAITAHFFAIEGAAAILPAHDAFTHGVGANRPHGMEHIDFLVANLIGIESDHRFHGHKTKELHQVILHHVAQRAGLVVIATAMPDTHCFGHGDSHIVNVTPVPNRLEERIGEAERQNVLHRLFAQVMVDAENLRFMESFP